jgi:hypothetical protein
MRFDDDFVARCRTVEADDSHMAVREIVARPSRSGEHPQGTGRTQGKRHPSVPFDKLTILNILAAPS